MTAYELAKLVKRMRDMQTAYFKSRTVECLRVAKDSERRVDAALKRIIANAETTPAIPGMEGAT